MDYSDIISLAYSCIAWCMIRRSFECISLAKDNAVSSVCEFLPFLGPRKHLVVVVQGNMK